MSLPSTTLDAWFAKAKAAFRTYVGGAVDFWPNVYAVIAKSLAVLSQEMDLRRAILFRQIFVKDADADYVALHAYEYGIAPRPAGRATGSLTITALGSGTLNAGLAFQRDDGVVFQLVTSTVVAAGAVTIPVQCDATGETGNTATGATLSLLGNGGGLVDTVATVASPGIAGGTPAETTDALRARVLARKRTPPQGGNIGDWTRWAQEVPGVGRVAVDSFSNTDRRVWVAFTMPARAGGIPNSGDVAVLQAYLNDPMRRPVTARVTVVAPVASAVAVTATGVSPLTAATIAAINTELAALFAERMQIVTPNRSFILPRAWVSEAISRAIGEDRHTLTVPSSDLVFSTSGTLPVLGTVTLS